MHTAVRQRVTFGFATTIDLLSWVIAALLGVKLVATLILLRRDPSVRLITRSGASLWWATKVTPLLAVPCMVLVAAIEHDAASFTIYSMLMLFVAIAVPAVVWRRFRRRAR